MQRRVLFTTLVVLAMVVSAILPSIALAASPWSRQVTPGGVWNLTGIPSGTTSVIGVTMLDDSHACAVGYGGAVWLSSDGGEAWTAAITTGTTHALYNVHFTDALHGCAVGENGVAVLTTDGGHHWTPAANAATGGELFGLAFTSASNAVAVGDDGDVVLSADGGNHWASAESTAPAKWLDSVAFTDASHGCAVGAAGAVVLTSDGGHHWSPAPAVGTTKDLYGVTFTDASHGCAVGNGGTIVLTSDGGQHWSLAASSGTTGLLAAVAFGDTLHGWAVGDNGQIVATSDGGQHWALVPSFTSSPLNGVSFADASHGCAVGNGGTIVRFTAPPLRAVSFPDSIHGFAVGDNGLIIHTDDGGSNWTTQTSGLSDNLRGVWALSPSVAWAVSDQGVVAWTTNAGTSWTSAPITAYPLYAVRFSDPLDGVAVGDNGRSFSTTDGGQVWKAHASLQSGALYCLTTAGAPNLFWTGGASYGGLFWSNDAGSSWHGYGTTNHNVNGLAFTDSQHGFAACNEGRIWATSDAGAHWSEEASPTPRHLHAIGFIDANRGWAVGDGGVIAATSDGGAHWALEDTATTDELDSVCFSAASDPYRGWAVGAGGDIMTMSVPWTVTAMSKPSPSSTRLHQKSSATFTSTLSPPSAYGGTCMLSVWHWESKTVHLKIHGHWRRVKTKYWHLRGTLRMSAAGSGLMSAKAKLNYSGAWHARAIYTGATGFKPAASPTLSFSVK